MTRAACRDLQQSPESTENGEESVIRGRLRRKCGHVNVKTVYQLALRTFIIDVEWLACWPLAAPVTAAKRPYRSLGQVVLSHLSDPSVTVPPQLIAT